jgi:uncharacterized membrane protein YdjX (TVP38/TMEM64 family)
VTRSLQIILYSLLFLALTRGMEHVLQPYHAEVQAWLTSFGAMCHDAPLMSYAVYGALLTFVLFLGLPFATGLMLFAGVTYDLGEAMLMVTLCRMVVAVGIFTTVRARGFKAQEQAAGRFFAKRPALGLFLMRLVPLPGNAINYTMARSTAISWQAFVGVTLFGMIPLTALCVWGGHQLGSVSNLLQWMS